MKKELHTLTLDIDTFLEIETMIQLMTESLNYKINNAGFKEKPEYYLRYDGNNRVTLSTNKLHVFLIAGTVIKEISNFIGKLSVHYVTIKTER